MRGESWQKKVDQSHKWKIMPPTHLAFLRSSLFWWFICLLFLFMRKDVGIRNQNTAVWTPSQSDQIHIYILIKGQLFITTLLVYSQNSKLVPLTVFLSKKFFFLLNLAQFRTRPNCNYISSLWNLLNFLSSPDCFYCSKFRGALTFKIREKLILKLGK